MYKQIIKKMHRFAPTQEDHMNDNINMDSTIAGSTNILYSYTKL